jgi:hypothetical protein
MIKLVRTLVFFTRHRSHAFRTLFCFLSVADLLEFRCPVGFALFENGLIPSAVLNGDVAMRSVGDFVASVGDADNSRSMTIDVRGS